MELYEYTVHELMDMLEKKEIKISDITKSYANRINDKEKDYIDEEDFFLSCEVFIGPQKENYVYEVYDFNVISIKRLYEGFPDNGIMLNKGWMIMKYYDESEMKQKINAIIKNCISDTDKNTYLNISSYFRMQES